jgi:hypothetical protein
LPIWTEFMKRAHGRRSYRGAGPFPMPDGVVAVPVDPANGLLASAGAPNAKNEVFVTGTQPTGVSGGGSGTQVASWDAPVESGTAAATAPAESRVRARRPVMAQQRPKDNDAPAAPQAAPVEEKKGVFGRIGEWFKRRGGN